MLSGQFYFKPEISSPVWPRFLRFAGDEIFFLKLNLVFPVKSVTNVLSCFSNISVMNSTYE